MLSCARQVGFFYASVVCWIRNYFIIYWAKHFFITVIAIFVETSDWMYKKFDGVMLTGKVISNVGLIVCFFTSSLPCVFQVELETRKIKVRFVILFAHVCNSVVASSVSVLGGSHLCNKKYDRTRRCNIQNTSASLSFNVANIFSLILYWWDILANKRKSPQCLYVRIFDKNVYIYI